MWCELSRLEKDEKTSKRVRVGVLTFDTAEIRQGDDGYPVHTLTDGRQVSDLPAETVRHLGATPIVLEPAERAQVAKALAKAAETDTGKSDDDNSKKKDPA